MSEHQIHSDDEQSVRNVVRNADALLLDFDGPMCSVFAGIPASRIAARLRAVLAGNGYHNLPPEVDSAEDPFAVLRYAESLTIDDVRLVEAELAAQERKAVLSAQPTPYSIEVVQRSYESGKQLAVVSNNSPSSISNYLRRFDIHQFFSGVFARSFENRERLKPNPDLLKQAMASLNVEPRACVMIGDSSSDLLAAQAAGVPAIAYANKTGKLSRLSAYGPIGVITTMASLLI